MIYLLHNADVTENSCPSNLHNSDTNQDDSMISK